MLFFVDLPERRLQLECLQDFADGPQRFEDFTSDKRWRSGANSIFVKTLRKIGGMGVEVRQPAYLTYASQCSSASLSQRRLFSPTFTPSRSEHCPCSIASKRSHGAYFRASMGLPLADLSAELELGRSRRATMEKCFIGRRVDPCPHRRARGRLGSWESLWCP